MRELYLIKQAKENPKFSKGIKWLEYLIFTKQNRVNLERINSMDELNSNIVLDYVERTLIRLDSLKDLLDTYEFNLVKETLIWSEVAKCGNTTHKRLWEKKNHNLFLHNIGSSQIYAENQSEIRKEESIIMILIKTHGLIGQYIRGEVNPSESKELTELIHKNYITKSTMSNVLFVLNKCIIQAISFELWNNTCDEVKKFIDRIINDNLNENDTIYTRLSKLRTNSIKNGEDFEKEFNHYFSEPRIYNIFLRNLSNIKLWYVEAALQEFSFEEFIKIFLIIFNEMENSQFDNLSFELFMNSLYYQHKDKKKINIYKKRVIEKYLAVLTVDNIFDRNYGKNPHLSFSLELNNASENVLTFDFKFSPAGSKLIEFCVEAEKSDVLYEKAIVLLFDLFELRKDEFDRFHNEESYLSTMNSGINNKKILLDYIVGDTVVDIGPGGGIMLDMISNTYPEKKVIGIDFSKNVIDTLNKRKHSENKSWEVTYGNALSLEETMSTNSVDTILFSSVIHELFSYIEFEGKKFNKDTIKVALQSAYNVLKVGGRIVIRDGIMTEPKDLKRIIHFKTNDGMSFLQRYASDFKGRTIEYSVVGHNEVLMNVNDAMEFLYTYTWGEESYIHEVNEQFGYFTPTEYIDFIKEILPNSVKIVKSEHFLQEGYTISLSSKIDFYDANKEPVALPDSTCIIVIEK